MRKCVFSKSAATVDKSKVGTTKEHFPQMKVLMLEELKKKKRL
jgi:hypothetical protein